MKKAGKQINYTEGTCFFVPLREGGFARGIVVRLDGDGRIFAHFFGPKLTQAEGCFEGVGPQDAELSGLCGDLGLLKGHWPQAGELKDWNRSDWPLPAFYREDESDRLAWLSYYDDDSLNFVREEPVGFRGIQYTGYPYDRLMGYGSVEIRLTKSLS
jgi:hypothetical protein